MKKPFDKGYDVFSRGYMYEANRIINLKANPYKPNTHANREWERGFNTAYFKRLQKVKNNESRRAET